MSALPLSQDLQNSLNKAMIPTTDAASGATLSGSGWLSNLLKEGLSGYIAVETVRAQRRQADSVLTQDIPRLDAPPAEPAISQKTLLLAGGIVAVSLVLVLFLRRK